MCMGTANRWINPQQMITAKTFGNKAADKSDPLWTATTGGMKEMKGTEAETPQTAAASPTILSQAAAPDYNKPGTSGTLLGG